MKRALILIALLAAGCVENVPDGHKPEVGLSRHVARVDDPERGVTCYVYAQQGRRGGISCVRTDPPAVERAP